MKYEFAMNEREAEVTTKWMSDHVCVPSGWRFWRTVPPCPSFTYSFSPTGIGDSVIVSCHCGAKRDVTDYGSW